MRVTCLIAAFMISAIAATALATQEFALSLSEVRMVSPGMEDTGQVSLLAKIDKDGKWTTFEAEAFGRTHQLDDQQRAALTGFPLSGIKLGYAGAAQGVADHSVSFRIARLISETPDRTVESVVHVSITKNNQLRMLGPSEEQSIRVRP